MGAYLLNEVNMIGLSVPSTPAMTAFSVASSLADSGCKVCLSVVSVYASLSLIKLLINSLPYKSNFRA